MATTNIFGNGTEQLLIPSTSVPKKYGKGWILMSYPKPGPYYSAKADGTWEDITPKETVIENTLDTLDSQRTAALLQGFTFVQNGEEYKFRTDILSTVLLFSQVLLIVLGLDSGGQFECEDNKYIKIDSTNAAAILATGNQFIRSIYDQFKEQKEEVLTGE